MKNKEFIKILKVEPINFNLKTLLEKESILNSYKLFLKTCNFDIQILIQSNKEDLSEHFSKLEKNIKKENKKVQKYLNQYIIFIQEFNRKRKSSSKNFYIIIKEIPENKKEISKIEKILCENLNEKYFKIKECLARCGNIVKQYEEKGEEFFKNKKIAKKEFLYKTPQSYEEKIEYLEAEVAYLKELLGITAEKVKKKKSTK